MANDRDTQLRDENPHQGASTTFGRPSEDREENRQATDGNAQSSDRERSIETGREGRQSRVLSRRRQTPTPLESYGYSTSPFSLVRRMADDMDRMFESMLGRRGGFGLNPTLDSALERELWNDTSALNTVWSPQVETFRRGDKLVIRADLPGLNKDDIKIEVEENLLTISGERSEEHEETQDDFYRSERSYGQFYRSIPLPEGVKGDEAEASFKDGVLEVTLPAPEQLGNKGRRIQIR